MINIAIIEDEVLAAERLVKLIKQYDPEINVVKNLDTIKDSIEFFINNEHPDLVFMDIQLGDGKSLDIFKEVALTSHIIFVTAHDDFALQAFKFNSVDYILKPVKRVELVKAMEKYHANAHTQQSIRDIQLKYNQLKEREGREIKTRFLAKRGSRYFSIEAEDVAFIYTKERMHFIKTRSNVDYIIDNNLDELEIDLDTKMFYRANRQFILNYKCIEEVIVWFDGKLKIMVKPAYPEEIIISRLKSGEFKEWLSK